MADLTREQLQAWLDDIALEHPADAVAVDVEMLRQVLSMALRSLDAPVRIETQHVTGPGAAGINLGGPNRGR